MRGRSWSALVVGTCVLAACGGGSSSKSSNNDESRARVIVSAMASETARFHTTIAVETLDLDVDGVIDFANNVGSARIAAARSATTTTTDDLGDCDSVSAPTEVRWIGATVYSHTDAAAAGSSDPCGNGPSVGGKPWAAEDARRLYEVQSCQPADDSVAAGMVLGSLSIAANSPSQVLSELQSAGATLEQVGTDTIGGVATTHWRVTLGGPAVSTSTIPGCVRPSESHRSHVDRQSTDLWTDAQNRLRRVRTSVTTTETPTAGQASSTTTDPSDVFTITQTLTTDLSDFGVSVKVVAPPGNEVYDDTAAQIALVRGVGTVAANDWRVIARGVFDTGPWTVWYAPTTTGWQCFDVQGVPAPDGLPFSNENHSPEHDGRVAQCPLPGGIPEGDPFTVFVSQSSGDRWVLVGAVSEGVEAARLTFDDGSSVALSIDPTTDLVQWSGPATRPPRTIGTNVGSCRLTSEPSGLISPCYNISPGLGG